MALCNAEVVVRTPLDPILNKISQFIVLVKMYLSSCGMKAHAAVVKLECVTYKFTTEKNRDRLASNS